MKRVIPVFFCATLAALVLMPAARALDSASHRRPPGIAASAWVPLSGDLAAVVEQPPADPYARDQRLPSALGYFVAWHDDHWLRLDSLLLQPSIARNPAASSVWMGIDRNLAFVIGQRTPAQPLRGEEAGESAVGYFVIKRSGQWLRLDPVAQTALFRGPAQSTRSWFPVDRNLRFVVEHRAGQSYVVPLGGGQLPSALGYFVGKSGGRWVRLDSIV